MPVWSASRGPRTTVEAFENGQRKSVALEELILLSYAFQVEPNEWFVGRGWAKLTPDAMASLKVIRAMLAGSPTAQWIRIHERMWDRPQFDDAPRVMGAQFEKLNERLRKAEEYLGPDFTPAAAIHAMEAAAGPAEVKAAYKMHVKPLDISLAGITALGAQPHPGAQSARGSRAGRQPSVRSRPRRATSPVNCSRSWLLLSSEPEPPCTIAGATPPTAGPPPLRFVLRDRAVERFLVDPYDPEGAMPKAIEEVVGGPKLWGDERVTAALFTAEQQ